MRYGSGSAASDAPLTAGSRGVALCMSVGIAAIAALTAAGLAKPAFPNEPAIAAFAYLAGAVCGCIGWLRKETAKAAVSWAAVNIALAILMLLIPEALGLA